MKTKSWKDERYHVYVDQEQIRVGLLTQIEGRHVATVVNRILKERNPKVIAFVLLVPKEEG